MNNPLMCRDIRPAATNRYLWLATSCNGAFTLMAFKVLQHEGWDWIDQSGAGEFVPVHEVIANRSEVGIVARVAYTYNDDVPRVHDIQRARAELNFILATV